VLIFLASTLILGIGINLLNRLKIQKLRQSVVYLKAGNEIVSPESRLDINQATAEQLEALPGIGPVLAQRIVSYRERQGGFKSTKELLNVSGIGPKRFETIRDLITCNSKSK